MNNDLSQSIITRLDDIRNATLLAAKDTLTIEECSLLTGFSVSTLHSYTSRRVIPFFKRGKCCFFSKKQVENWLTACPVPTREETLQKAATYTAINKPKF